MATEALKVSTRSSDVPYGRYTELFPRDASNGEKSTGFFKLVKISVVGGGVHDDDDNDCDR